MTLEEFREKFEEIKRMGYIKSLRRGNTGIGHTLEQKIGLKENNLALPDIDKYELKGHRIGSSSLVTLFTMDTGAWKLPQLQAIRKYGIIDKKNRKALKYTISPNINSAGLYLKVENDLVSIVHAASDFKLASWDLNEVAERFQEKFAGMLFVTANSEKRKEGEYFQYVGAKILQGTSASVFMEQFKNGIVKLDLRMHDAGFARNRGTAFRIFERDFPNLFSDIREL